MTRPAAPEERPVALTIAGSDSGGGAGIQADLQSMAAHGVFGTSVVTAVTAQNTRGVDSSFVLPTGEIDAQIDAVLSDFDVAAIKTGMLATAPVVELVADRLDTEDTPTVIDPVMVAASGDRLLDASAEAAYDRLIDGATLVTPNTDEAAVLTDRSIDSDAAAEAVGADLIDRGAGAALIKGGHREGDRVTDLLVTPETTTSFTHDRIETKATHGSGCTLASSIAAQLASGAELADAVATGLAHVQRAIRYPVSVGGGPGPVNHQSELRTRAALPEVRQSVSAVVSTVVDSAASELVPEVGMNVVGAAPMAESVADTVAVEGRIMRTSDGLRTTAGIGVGASSHLATFVLAARDITPAYRFCVNCRVNDRIENALAATDLTVRRVDRTNRPGGAEDASQSALAWAARTAVSRDDDPGLAVIDPGAHGIEPSLKLLHVDHEELVTALRSLHSALPSA